MEYNIDEIVTREQEQGWHEGRLINAPESAKIPTGPVGSQPGWTKSLGLAEPQWEVTADELNELPKHIVVTTDLDYANKLCEDWYYLKGTNKVPEGLQFILQRLTKKRLYQE